jgi:Asp-tRNA(Asn)/Glu-tRNA(Gln) amidotransferase A subunit family amidase
MNNEPTKTAEIAARLRLNIRMTGIPVGEDDLKDMEERGYFQIVERFEQAMESIPRDIAPDTGAWTVVAEGPPAESFAAEVATAEPVNLPVNLPPGHTDAEPLAFASLRTVAALLRERQVSAVELAILSLNRISRFDPTLNAFQLILADEAMAAARAADQEIGSGRYRGALHGVPVAVKDLFAMHGTPTWAGSSRALPGFETFDSTAVERLRAAGAVIVGKTRLSEFAYSPGSNNRHYGPVANPWNMAHDAGGSSSGSGAAVAAGLVYAALGTDTGGSIRIPASLCGVVGLKPTFGRTSLAGAVALSWSLDHLGPLARSAGDCAVLLDVLTGIDRRDPRTASCPPPRRAHAVAGLRIGMLGDDGTGRPLASDDVLAAWRRGLTLLEEQGAVLVPIDIKEVDLARQAHAALLVLEALTQHQGSMRQRWRDLGEFPRRRMLYGLGHTPTAYVRAQQARSWVRARIEARFTDIDVLSTPTMPAGASALGVPGSTAFTGPFNLLGLPAISAPVGFTADALPVGLQLVGLAGDEATVLAAVAALEAVRQ